jgi:O-antigen/teichoic acid export membrane protein
MPDHPTAPRSRSEVVDAASPQRRLIRRWRVPGLTGLELNAMALMSSTAITGLAGVGFWAVAARLPAAEVGRAAAVLSTAAMLAQLSSSNVGVLFGRVLASAGVGSRRLVLAGYGVAVLLSILLGAGFVLIVRSPILQDDLEKSLFPVAVAMFSLFSVQDWVLTGIRRSRWVPLEQLFFAVAKLVLLVFAVSAGVGNGILLSWIVPLVIAVVVVNAVLLGQMLPGRRAPAEGAAPMPSGRELRRLFLAEYTTGAVTSVIPLTLPLLVVAVLGAEANAYYAIPWLIGESLGLLIWNIGSSYLVESAHDERQAASLMARTVRLILVVGGPGVAGVLVAAPWILSIFGSAYAEQGSLVLRLMVLAIPFNTVSMLYLMVCRLRFQLRRVVALQALTATLVIGLTIILLRPLGIAGAGWGYLVAEVVVAALVVVPLVRFLRTRAG